jgi:hypothetical protein
MIPTKTVILNQAKSQRSLLTNVSIGYMLAVFALLSAQSALANAPPLTIDSIAPRSNAATITFTPGADNGSPMTGYRYIKDGGTASSTILATTGVYPSAIAIDAAGNVYTVNALDKNVSKITPDSTSTLLGTTGKDPQGVAIDLDGNVYTANFSSDDVSKKLVSGLHHVLAHSNFTADQHVVTG